MTTIVPYNYITNKLSPLKKRIFLYLFIFTILLLIISSIISINMSKRFQSLKDTMKSIAKNKELNLNNLVEDNNDDEISMLANQFNQMITQIDELIQKNYKAKIKEKELLFLEKEAELNALQQQINPHFLYNTLENIKWLGYKHGDMEICNMITALSDFFRENISHKDKFITLEKELKHLDNYIYIQNKRYKDKFKIIKSITTEANKTEIPKLILQPLIENSIKHGLEPLENGGKVYIKAKIIENNLRLIVKDNGMGIRKKELNELINDIKNKNNNQHFGLKNVYQRIKLYYDDFKFDIKSEYKKGTKVLIEIRF
jgi:two-component system sensor histidine kinase YesM